MRIFCWNINGLTPTAANVKLKHGSLKKFFEEEQHADIVCFQETKLTNQDIKSSKATLTEEVALIDGFQSFWACSRARAGYSGVVTYASTEWAPPESESDCLGGGEADIDQEGRIVITDHGAFVLLNVYAPNAGDRPARARLPYKLRFLEALKEKMDLLHGQGREVVLVGDLNIAPTAHDVHKDIDFGCLYSAEELAVMAELLRDYTDVWRVQHPETTNVFSVWEERVANRLINKGLRMDFAVVSKGLLPHVVSCEILQDMPPKWSDHAPVVLELQGLQPPQPQKAPCAAWTQLLKRFRDPKQRSLASMWGAKASKPVSGGGAANRSAATTAAGGAGVLAGSATEAGATAACPGAAAGLPEASKVNDAVVALDPAAAAANAVVDHSAAGPSSSPPTEGSDKQLSGHERHNAVAGGGNKPEGKRCHADNGSEQPKKQKVHPFFAQHVRKAP